MLVRGIASFIAVIVAAKLLPAYVGYETVAGVVVFAAILAVLNTFVKPVLSLVTAPIGCLTLGLFVLVINAFLFWLAAQLSGGQAVWVNGAWGPFLGGLVVSLVSMAVARLT